VPSGNVIPMWSKVTPDVLVSGGEPRGMQFLSVSVRPDCGIVRRFRGGSLVEFSCRRQPSVLALHVEWD
jgi:hypothetical protein